MSPIVFVLVISLAAIGAFCVIALLFNLCAAPFRIYRDDQETITSLRKERLEIEQAKPCIKIKKTFVDCRPLVNRKSGQVIGTPFFAHVIFVNEPANAVPNAVAKDVIATISYCDDTGKEIASVNGRWGDSPQPTDPFNPMIDLVPAEFKIGLPRELNIALKYPEDDSCYGFHNGSYFQPEWRDPSLKLLGEEYEVKVLLRGPWVDETYTFFLRNLGKGKSLEIQEKKS